MAYSTYADKNALQSALPNELKFEAPNEKALESVSHFQRGAEIVLPDYFLKVDILMPMGLFGGSTGN